MILGRKMNYYLIKIQIYIIKNSNLLQIPMKFDENNKTCFFLTKEIGVCICYLSSFNLIFFHIKKPTQIFYKVLKQGCSILNLNKERL